MIDALLSCLTTGLSRSHPWDRQQSTAEPFQSERTVSWQPANSPCTARFHLLKSLELYAPLASAILSGSRLGIRACQLLAPESTHARYVRVDALVRSSPAALCPRPPRRRDPDDRRHHRPLHRQRRRRPRRHLHPRGRGRSHRRATTPNSPSTPPTNSADIASASSPRRSTRSESKSPISLAGRDIGATPAWTAPRRDTISGSRTPTCARRSASSSPSSVDCVPTSSSPTTLTATDGHPDHIQAHRVTTEAVAAAAGDRLSGRTLAGAQVLLDRHLHERDGRRDSTAWTTVPELGCA